MQQMGGLGQHRMQGIVEGGRAARGAQGLAGRSGLAHQRSMLQYRTSKMDDLIRTSPGSVTQPMSGALSRGYTPQAVSAMTGPTLPANAAGELSLARSRAAALKARTGGTHAGAHIGSGGVRPNPATPDVSGVMQRTDLPPARRVTAHSESGTVVHRPKRVA